jgi:hypothetical protein
MKYNAVNESISEFMKMASLDQKAVSTDRILDVEMSCCACGSPLTIEEMHYLSHGNGKATCCACETKWTTDVTAWRHGAPGEFPSRPGRNDKFPEPDSE